MSRVIPRGMVRIASCNLKKGGWSFSVREKQEVCFFFWGGGMDGREELGT